MGEWVVCLVVYPLDVKDRLEELGFNPRETRVGVGSSIDFEMYRIVREDVTDNFVFRGTRFQSVLFRCPRVPKCEFSRGELREYVVDALPYMSDGVRIDLEPELPGLAPEQDEFWYIHVRLGSPLSAKECLDLIEGFYDAYEPPY